MKKNYFYIVFIFLTVCANAQCWKEVSAEYQYSAGIKTDGTLWIWGMLGTSNAYVFSTVPIQIGTATNWKTLSAGRDYLMAIQSNGTLWGIGDNAQGQLGNGTSIGSATFVQIGTDTDWISVSCTGYQNTIALKTNGTLWGWGANNSGQLGDGTSIGRLFPAQIGTDIDWKIVSTGWQMAAAIKTNGSLWVWGSDMWNGAVTLGLGPGPFINILPTQIGNDLDWAHLSIGSNHTMALKNNGTLWGWGNNTYGSLGNGTNITEYVPVQIGTATDWKEISGGNVYSMGLKTTGTLWTWGNNIDGQLGVGNNVNTNIPVQVGTANNWQSMDAGLGQSIAIKTDGSAWDWGVNNIGQLGDGSFTNSTIPIEILSPSITVISTSTLVCIGSSLTLSGSGALTYTWSSGVADGVSFVPASSTIYTVTGTDAIGCYNRATVEITVAPYTTVTAHATSTVVCSGATVTLNGSGANSYLWSNGVTDGNSFTMGTTTIFTVVDSTSCSNTASITVNVISSPTITINSSAIVCAGMPVTLSASGATTYTWSSGITNGVPFVPIASAIYTVTGNNTNGCYDTSIVAITVTPNTTVTANATSTTVCSGGTVALTGSGATNYAWSGSVVNGQSFSPVGTATYTVTDTTGCSNTASITVNVTPIPTVSVNSTSICSGSNAVLTATATPMAGTTYSWSTAATGNTLSVNPSATTFYTVTSTNTGCSASAIASISVTPVVIPVTGFSYASPVCMSSSNPLPMPNSGFSASGTYFSGAGLNINATTGLIDLSLSNAGTYIVTYSVAANGCNPSSSNIFTITLNAPTVPVTNFSYASPLCQNDVNPSPLLASNFVNAGTFNSGGLNVNATNGTIDLASSTAGNYTVSYQVNAANCVQAGTSTTTVVINSNPTLSTSSSTVIINGEQTVLTASSSANTYTWFPTTSLSCTNCANPTASPNVTTNYCVQTTDGVCTNSACINVIVESLCEGDKGLYLPNAFSPNGDGNNDVFCVQGEAKCTTDFKMLIFDRWGEKIFESTAITFCWDGTYKSKALNPDVYVYYITAINKDKEKITKKGNVTLIK